MVDWALARQVARLAAGAEVESADPGGDIVGLSTEMEAHVADYTRLELHGQAPAPELLTREEWAAMNLESLSQLLEPVAARLDQRMAWAGPLAGALRAATGATLAAEAGLVMGYVSTRVLGQYELSLLQPEAPPRLVYVGANLRRAARELRVDRDSFYGWIAIHELTHVFQFQGVPWLRDHVSRLLRDYMRTVEVRIDSGAAGGLPSSLPNPARLVESFREGGLAALVQTREQRSLMRRLQSVMAVIEGYSDHVMDALGSRLLPAFDGLRRAMDGRRRSRSAPERVLERLLGLDMKLRQYELGRGFCDGVAREVGVEGLNRVWAEPAALPSLMELESPATWLARQGEAPAAA